jgi:ABC-type glycerol-3-phosphate transport system substrate-binding protein
MEDGMKRFVALGSSVLVAIIPALSTGAQARSVQAPPKPVEVTMFASHDPSWQGNNLATNTFTNYVQSQFNLKINWIVAPPTDAAAKQQLLLQSGNYPPVFYNGNFPPAQLAKYGKQGILVSLNKYLQQYAPNVVKALHDFTGAAQAVTDPQGNIWGIPSLNYCLHCDFSAKIWINTTWLAKLHLKMPHTTAQFAAVMHAFKSIPGVKNPIPLTGASDGWHSDPTIFLMNAFQYTDGDIGGTNPNLHVYYQNGKLAFAPIQPQWQQGLEYIHSLATDRVLDSSAFTQQTQSALKPEVAAGRVGAVAYGVDNGFVTYSEALHNKSSDWVVVPPLTGPNSANYAAFFGQGPTNAVFTITNKATPAQIKAILTFVNWIYTVEGTSTMDFGAQGPNSWHLLPANTTQKGLCAPKAIQYINWNGTTAVPYQNFSWNQLGPMYQSKAWRCGGPWTPVFDATSEEEKYQYMTETYYEGHQPSVVYPAAVWFPAADLTQYATLNTTINQYVTQWTYDFILGRKSITGDWNTYVNGLKGLGLDSYLQILSSNAKPESTSEFCPAKPSSLPCHH